MVRLVFLIFMFWSCSGSQSDSGLSGGSSGSPDSSNSPGERTSKNDPILRVDEALHTQELAEDAPYSLVVEIAEESLSEDLDDDDDDDKDDDKSLDDRSEIPLQKILNKSLERLKISLDRQCDKIKESEKANIRKSHDSLQSVIPKLQETQDVLKACLDGSPSLEEDLSCLGFMLGRMSDLSNLRRQKVDGLLKQVDELLQDPDDDARLNQVLLKLASLRVEIWQDYVNQASELLSAKIGECSIP